MKCEICREKDAETAIAVQRNGVEEELYVCHECAQKERVSRQKKSQRTRKDSGPVLDMSISVSQPGDGEEPPPIVKAFMNAMNDMVSDLEKMSSANAGAGQERGAKPEKKKPKWSIYPLSGIDEKYLIDEMLHLEGLHLIGELKNVQRAFKALDLELVGISADGTNETGHAFAVRYTCSSACARTVVKDVVAQERNARRRLVREMPRVFGDSICRALAILKNCRLLSPGELYDLLSPLRLAAQEKLLDGITLAEIKKMAAAIDLTSKEDDLFIDERDRIDADRADDTNSRFEDVVLNERAEELFR